MSIKNLKYDLTPQEIFQIFMRDYDKYTKEEINVFLEYLIGESEKYVRAGKLIELYDDIRESCRKKFSRRFNIVNENLDVFVNTLSKFLYESTNINVNEPIIIDENVYMNYLNHLGNGGKLLTTRLENDYIFNSCIHSKVGYRGDTNYFYFVNDDWYTNEEYVSNSSDFSNYGGRFRYLPIYLEFKGHSGTIYGWINNPKYSSFSGIFFPMPFTELATFNGGEMIGRYRKSDPIRWFDFSVGEFKTGYGGSFDNSGKGGLESSSMIIKKDDSFILNCNLPNYIFKCYKDEGGIFDRTNNYFREESIWNSGYQNNFPIITEYNPVERDMSYRATPKFGKHYFWNMKGILFENDKDFMQVIKKEDVKYQGDLAWMKNNFYISNFIYIPEIYIFIKFLYHYKSGNNSGDKLVKEFRNLINDVTNDNQLLDQLLLFIINAYVLEFEDGQFYADVKEYQELMYLENSIGIINFIKNIDICEAFYNSWGKTLIGSGNILKNISYSNYEVVDSDKTFDYFSSYVELSSDLSAQMINFFGIAENVNIGIPESLVANDNYRCHFFTMKDEHISLFLIEKKNGYCKLKRLSIIGDWGLVLRIRELFSFEGTVSDFSEIEEKVYFGSGWVTYNAFDVLTECQGMQKHQVLLGNSIDDNQFISVNDLNFSIRFLNIDFLNLVSYSTINFIPTTLSPTMGLKVLSTIIPPPGILFNFNVERPIELSNYDNVGGDNYSYFDIGFMDDFIDGNQYSFPSNYIDETIYGGKLGEQHVIKGFIGFVDNFHSDSVDLLIKIFERKTDVNMGGYQYKYEKRYRILYGRGFPIYELKFEESEIKIPFYGLSSEIGSYDPEYVDLWIRNHLEYEPSSGFEPVNMNQIYYQEGVGEFSSNQSLTLIRSLQDSTEYGFYQSYELPMEIPGITTINRKILKKKENEMVNQDMSNVTVDMLDKAFYDWDKVPFYMYKTRIGKKEMATVKGKFLTRLLENIRNNHFKLIVKEEESLIETPVIEER